MSNYQAEPRSLFKERKSRVFVLKDEIPDLTKLSIDSSLDLDKSSRTHRISNFSIPSLPAKRVSIKPTNFEPTFVYDGIEDKVFIRK